MMRDNEAVEDSSKVGGAQAVSPFPVWLNFPEGAELQVDPQWLSTATGLIVVSCSARDFSRPGRPGTTWKLEVNLQGNKNCEATLIVDEDEGEGARKTTDRSGTDGSLVDTSSSTSQNASSTTTLPVLHWIMKQSSPDTNNTLSKQLGLAREALFYKEFAAEIPVNTIPTVFYSHGNMTTGQKVTIMQDLSSFSIDSSACFGPGNPHNWNRPWQEDAAKAGSPSAHKVANATFTAMARLHAHFWRQSRLLKYDWLRGQGWLQGQDQASWEASQAIIQGIWNQDKYRHAIEWDPVLYSIVDRAMQNISWKLQVERLNADSHWTLVHGDFWPGNVLWLTGADDTNRVESAHAQSTDKLSRDSPIRLIDFEMCGLGSGPQDLGQYILSNMDPIERRQDERKLIQDYHAELLAHGVEVDWECCWREYVHGGLERWIWFLVYFLSQTETLPGWAEFFHSQMASFVQDHDITADKIGQPRA
jgi:Ecdysteroid kinase-like family